jgi:enoyl-CoA hydratase/carnithine racemase
MSDLVRTGVAEGVCTILLNRPEKKNALTLAMYQAMADAVTDAVARPEVRVIVLGSEGPNFTAGNDLADFLQNPSMDRFSLPGATARFR